MVRKIIYELQNTYDFTGHVKAENYTWCFTALRNAGKDYGFKTVFSSRCEISCGRGYGRIADISSCRFFRILECMAADYYSFRSDVYRGVGDDEKKP